MKKKNVINLIKYFSEENYLGFKNEAYEIASSFDASGDHQLAEYIMALLSSANTFVPQMEESVPDFMDKVSTKGEMLLLPDDISEDLIGIVNAVSHNAGINKFLLQGAPGTGKTEAAKQIARIMDRDLYIVDFSSIIDSRLGQTQKNVSTLFKEINGFAYPSKAVILFDEIDALSLDRTNSNDLREMGRATSTLLKGLDNLDERIVLIATTNLYNHFDKAIIRRFDSIIDFNRYSNDDLIQIAEKMLGQYLAKFKLANKDVRLFRKIMLTQEPLPYPGDLKNIIKTAVAFSNPDDGTDYFRRLYALVNGKKPEDLSVLKEQRFTVREIEILTQKSKSSVARELKEHASDE